MSDRPAPTAEGQLSRTPFAHVLLYMRDRRLSGTLVVDAPERFGELAGESLLGFEEGCLTQVRLPTVIEPLGFVLRELNAIDDAKLNESLARLARREGLQGEILRAMGAIDDATLERALRTQVRRKALRLFAVTDAPYRYFGEVDLLDGWGGSRVREDVMSILWRGVRAYPDPRAMDAVLTRVTGNAVRLRTGADLRVFEFDRTVQGVIDTLRVDSASLDSLLSASQDATLARALVYVLLITKQAEIVAAGTPRQPTGTNLQASTARVHETPGGVAPTREQSSATTRSSRPSIPPRGSRPSIRPSRPSIPPGVPADVTPDLRDRFEEARVRVASMEDENYYQMLGITQSAGKDAVRAAYLDQAARWHPDRAPPQAPSLRELHQRIFAYLSEAQDTLTHDEQAPRYLRSVQDGGGTPNAQRRVAALIEAATDAQKAEVCIRRREWDEAERLARKSLAVAEDDPNSMCVLATAIMERRPDFPPSEEVMGLLHNAVTIAPKHDRAHVLYGAALKRRGDHKRALEQFTAALEANPKNTDAAREVRLAEMRARSGHAAPPSAPVEQPTPDAKKKLGESFIGRFLKK
jgi:tetratricopeptide (TPR) repeat protein